MALFSDPFNGSAGVEVTTMTKTKGGALFFKYNGAGNAICPDSTSADIRYRHDSWPGQKNYRAILRFQLSNPTGANDIVRLFARYDEVDLNGYYVQVDSNFDAPTVKLFKLVDGVATQIGSTFNPGAGAIPANTSRDIEIQVDGSTIIAWWNGNTSLSAPDISVVNDEIYLHEGIGVGTELCSATDVLIENLEVNEPRKALVSSVTGLLLKVDDEEYDEDRMKDLNIQITNLVKSVVSADTLEIIQKYPFNDPLFRPEQIVQLFVDISSVRTRVFHGKIRVVPQSGAGDDESITYTAYGYRANWQYISVEHPETLASEIVWNAEPPNEAAGEPGDDDYDSDFANMTVGEYIQYWLDYYEDTIKFYFGSDPAAGLPYVAGDLSALTNVPTKTSISGTLDTHIQQALQLQKNSVLVMDYGAGQLRIRDLDTLTPLVLGGTTKRIPSVELGLDTSRVWTAARAKGVTRELVQAQVDNEGGGGGLDPAWDTALEEFWSRERSQRKQATFKVVSTSLGTGPGGRDQVTLGSAADETFPNEWAGTSIRFTSGPAIGDDYEIYSNAGESAGTYLFTINGNFTDVPVVDNMVTVTDDQTLATTKRHNGFAYVYKLFQITDVDKRNIVKSKCQYANITYSSKVNGGAGTAMIAGNRVPVAYDTPKQGTGYVRLQNLAIIGPKDLALVYRPEGCNETSYEAFTDAGGKIELNFEYYKTTVVQARYPAEGWYGDAFSYDSAKWGVGSAVPGASDIGVMREELLNESEFRYAAQIPAWQAILTERVKLTSKAPWAGTISYRGLDWTNVNFTRYIDLQFDTARRGPANWDGQPLIPIQWTWDFLNNMNSISVGTMSSFARELEDQKKTNADLKRATTMMERRIRSLQDMQECMQSKPADTAGGYDHNPTCGTNIYTGIEDEDWDGGPGKGTDLDKRIKWIMLILLLLWDFLSEIWGWQKGITDIHTVDTDDDGNPDGVTFTFDGDVYEWTPDGGYTIGGIGVGSPFSGGFGGVEGSIQDTVVAQKAALEGWVLTGLEPVTGRLIFTDGTGSFTANGSGSGWVNPTTGLPYYPLFGGAVGGLLHNLGKTISNSNGSVLTPGSTVGSLGGVRYNPDGTTTALGSGATVPPSLGTIIAANKFLTEGAVVNANGTVTFPNGTFTPLTGGGWAPVAGSGPGGSTPTTGPVIGGGGGAVTGKCATTLDGKLTPGSGPGCLLSPGDTVGANRGIYYLPTEANPPEYEILEENDIVPASSATTLRAALEAMGLITYDLSDRGGVVYTARSKYWRVDPADDSIRQVDPVTAGTGVNDGDYSWTSPSAYFSAIDGYRFKGIQRYTSGSGTYTLPANVRAIRVRCWGGGGGGGGVSGAGSQAAAAGSGGAGGYCEKWITAPSSSYAWVIGTAGAGGGAGNNAGNDGANTTFGSSFLTAAKGTGGAGMATGTSSTHAAGGTGGTGTGGDINITGGDGGHGYRFDGVMSFSNNGADSPLGYGHGGHGGKIAFTGLAATGYGAGGSGASNNGASDYAGGAGSPGFIEIEEYYI